MSSAAALFRRLVRCTLWLAPLLMGHAATQPAAAPATQPGGPAPGHLALWLRYRLPDQPQPNAVCEKPELDGIAVVAGETAEWSWEVANTGGSELRLWLTPGWSGWYEVSAQVEPRWRIVLPGERAVVAASCTVPDDLCGSYTYCLSAQTNDRTTQRMELCAVLDVRPHGSVEVYEATCGPCGDNAHWLAPAPADAPQPRFVCEQTTADIGDVWSDKDWKPAWSIENAGAAPLRVLIQVDCCTCVRKGKLILAPGQRETVYAVAGVSGPFARTARATTNDPNQPNVELKLTGTRRNVVRGKWGDGKFRPLGVLVDKAARGATAQMGTALLVRGDGGPLQPRVRAIVPREYWHGPVASAAASVRELEAGERYALDVTFSPPWPEGDEWASAEIELETGVPEEPVVSVPVTIRMLRRLELRPRGEPLPRRRTEPVEWVVDLVWSDDVPPARILATTATDPGLRIRIEQRDGHDVVIVTVPPECGPSADGKVTPLVWVFTDDPTVPQDSIALRFAQ